MPQDKQSDYTRPEVALEYALCAERLYACNPRISSDEPAAIPVLVHLLYQSVEISLKHVGRYFNLWPEHYLNKKESLDRSHDVRALANAIQVGFPNFHIRAMLLAAVINDRLGAEFIGRMLLENEFEDTRQAYKNRTLGYAQLKSFTIFSSNTADWIQAVKETAQNLGTFIRYLECLRDSADRTPSHPEIQEE